MFVDAENKTITCKIAYYGPGLSGKTTNFQYLHDHAPIQAGNLISTDIDAERTLHFQFIRNDIPEFKDHRLIFDFHTIPGQSYYLSTRLQLLEGADGIVFVVDSTREAMDENIDSMNDLYENLRKQNIADDIPLCVQFNKQDNPSALPIEQLNPLLNSYMKQSFATSALSGQGIIETMTYITDEVMAYIENQGLESSSSYMAQDSGKPATAESNSLTPIQPNALNTSPVTSAITKNEYWLLTCFSCDSILEVPKAKPGDVFACGNCQQTLQVVDPEMGLTQAPQPVQPASGLEPKTKVEESSYSMQALPDGAGPAGPAPLPPSPGAAPAVPPPPPPSENAEYSLGSVAPDPQAGGSALAQSPQDGSGAQSLNLPQVLPNYTTLSQLDNSLLGQRYILLDQNTNSKVRAMVMSQEASRQPGFKSALDIQVKQATQVHHQNAAHFLGIQMLGEIPVLLSQETEDCESLKDVLDRRKKLSPPQAIDITHKLSLALNEINRRNISHGWVRPECIQIGPSGTVILDDIAVPKLHTYLVREGRGRTAATDYYLAPEHQTGEIGSDERSDIFLLGVLLFRMLTGEGMITGFSAHEALHKLTSGGPKQLRSVNPELSRELDSLCNQMCAIERKDRFQSLEELADLLAKFGGGAKRHTLRATRSHTRSVGPNRSAGVNQHTRTVRKTTTRHQRTASGPDNYNEFERGAGAKSKKPAKRKSSNLFTFILLILLIGCSIWAYDFYQKQEERLQQIRDANQPPPPKTTQPVKPNDKKTDTPTIKKSVVGQIEEKLAAFAKDPKNEALDKEIIALLGKLKQGKRRVQLIDKLKEIRENANTGGTTTKDPKTTDPVAVKDPKADKPNTAKLLQDIDYHLQRKNFGKALIAANLIPNQAVKETQVAKVTQDHKDAKTTLQLSVNGSENLSQINKLLEAPRNVWGVKGDREWADNLLAAAKKRIDAKKQKELDAIEQKKKEEREKQEDLAKQQESEGKLQPPVTLNGLNFKAILADVDVDNALNEGDLKKAQDIVKEIPGSSKEAQAISLKIQLESQAIDVMGKAFKNNRVRFRVKAPFNSREKWDVSGITQSGLELKSPQGSSATTKWAQLDDGERSKLFSAIAAHEMATAKEQAIACVSQLRDNQLGPATIAKNAARKNKYPNEKQLELLISMQRAQELANLVNTALKAHESGDNKSLNKSFRSLKQLTGLEKDADDFIEKLSKFITIPQQEEAHPNSLKDTLDFSDDNDLFAFNQQTGNWKVLAESLKNISADAFIQRSDMKGASRVSVKVLFAEQKGSMNINFRGGVLRMKVAEQKFHLLHGEKATKLVDYPFVPMLPYTIDLWIDSDKIMHVEINQAASQKIAIGQMTDSMSVDIKGNANVTLDDINYKREQTFALPEIDKAKQDMIRTVLGWEPYGGAELHAPVIKLPPWPGSRSGIARTLQAQDKGVEFKMSGSGDVFILIGDREKNNLDGQKIPLPMNSEDIVKVTVTWTGNAMRIETLEPLQASPNVVDITNQTVPRKHLCIESSKTINILEPPVMKR